MAERGFHLDVKRDAGTLVLRLRGDFDLAAIGRVETVLDRSLDPSVRHVVFDLSEVTFLDMAGLMTVMRANERSHDAAFDVQVVPPTGSANRVFTLTRAGDQLNMVDAVAV